MIQQKFLSARNLQFALITFFIYSCCAPSVRLLLIGGEEMKNGFEFFITALPDFLAFGCLLFALLLMIKNKFLFSPFDKIILFFILFNSVYGFILSRNIFISAQGFRVTYLPVLFYFTGRLLNEKDAEKNFSDKIFSWFILFGVIGLILHFCFRNFEIHLITLAGRTQSEYFIPRIGSLVLMPVLFATLMAIACLYFYYQLLTGKKILNYLFIAVLWSCIFLSVSRGPIIAFIAGFLFLTFIFREWKISALVFTIIIFVSSFWSFLLVGSLTPLAWLFSSAADTLTFGENITRVELWKHSIHDFIQRPWGYGLGHAGVTAIRFLKGATTPAAVYTSDGWFLKIACETGVLGLLSYLFLAGKYFFSGIKIISSTKNSFFVFTFSIFILINAQCVVGNTLDFYPLISLYWLFIGMSANYFVKK